MPLAIFNSGKSSSPPRAGYLNNLPTTMRENNVQNLLLKLLLSLLLILCLKLTKFTIFENFQENINYKTKYIVEILHNSSVKLITELIHVN